MILLTAKDLNAEERARLNRWVERIVQKGTLPQEELLAQLRQLVAQQLSHADPD